MFFKIKSKEGQTRYELDQ